MKREFQDLICIHLGKVINVQASPEGLLQFHRCEIHDICLTARKIGDVACCKICKQGDFQVIP